MENSRRWRQNSRSQERRVEAEVAAEWRYIGKPAPGYDVTDVCAGKPLFGMDVRVDGMLYAAIAHPPVLGGKVKSVDDSAALKVKGVKQTIPIDPFTPPHPFSRWGASRSSLTTPGRHSRDASAQDRVGQRRARASTTRRITRSNCRRRPGSRAKWCTPSAIPMRNSPRAARSSRREYFAPHLAHASMEPPVAVADVQGDKVTVWAPTQNPQGVQEQVAKRLGSRKRT